MTTISDKEFIFKLILDDGKFPGDEDAWAIWQYRTCFPQPQQARNRIAEKRLSPMEVFRYPRYDTAGSPSTFKVVRSEQEMMGWLVHGNFAWTQLVFPAVYPEMDDATAVRMTSRRGHLIQRVRNWDERLRSDVNVPELDWGSVFFQ